MLILLVAAIFILASSPGERFIKGIAEDRLRKELRLHVAIDDLETNLFSRLRIHEFVIGGAPDTSAEPVLSIENIDIGFNLFQLVFGDLEMDKISVNNIDINLHRDTMGKFNIYLLDSIIEASGTKPASDSTEEQTGFFIRLLSVDNLFLAYMDDSLRLKTKIDDFDTRLENLAPDRCDYFFSIKNITTSYSEIPFEAKEISSEGNWTGDMVRCDNFNMQFDSLAIHADGEIPLDADTRYDFKTTITGNPNTLINKINSVHELPAVYFDESLDIAINLTGIQPSPLIGITSSIPPFEFDRARSEGGNLAIRYRGDSVFIDTFELKTFGGEMTASGTAVMDSIPSADLNLRLEKIAIPEIWRTFYSQQTPNKGIVNADLNISGRGFEPEGWQIQSELSATELKYNNISLPDLRGAINFAGGIASLNVIEGDNLKIDISGRIKDDGISGRFSAVVSNLTPIATLVNLPDIDGGMFVKGTISGTTGAPNAAADIYLSRMHYLNFPLDTLESRIEYKRDSIYIRSAQFAGRYRTSDTGRPLLDIDSLYADFDYSGSLTGTMENPTGTLDIYCLKSGYGQNYLDSAALHIDFNGQNAIQHHGSLFKGTLSSTLGGNLDLTTMQGKLKAELFDTIAAKSQDSDSVSVESNDDEPQNELAGTILLDYNLRDTTDIIVNIDIDRLQLEIARHFIVDTLGIKGILDANISAAGDISNPDISTTGRFSSAGIDRVAFDTVLVRAGFHNDILEIRKFDIFGYEQSLSATTSLQLDRDGTGYYIPDEGRVNGQLTMQNFDISVLKSFMTGIADISGTVSIGVTWDGTLEQPGLSGDFAVDKGYILMSPDTYPIENITVGMKIRDTLLTVHHALARIIDNDYLLTGFIVVPDYDHAGLDLSLSVDDIKATHISGSLSSEQFDMQIKTDDFDLAVLGPFLTGVKEISGTLLTDVKIRGNPKDPEIDGRLGIRDLHVWPDTLPAPLDSGVVSIRFNRDKINLDNLYIRLNRGTIKADGYLVHDLADIVDIDIRLALDSINLSSPRTYSVLLNSARLTYKKIEDYYLLGGDIEFGESRLTANVNAGSILPWARTVETSRTELPPILAQTRLDVRIRESSNLWIDNNLARLRIHSELGIIGTPGLPNFNGRVNVAEGYILYLDRKFEVSKGDIYFTNPIRFNPEINFSAEASIKSYQATDAVQYTVTFSARGFLEELKTGLTSDPPLDKGDIISLLTLGATRSQMAGSEASFGGAVKARAQTFTSQRVSGFLTDRVGTVFGLDEVSVQGNLFSRNNSAGPQLLVSKRITDRAKLTYAQTVGHSNDQSIRLDYRLSTKFFLEGQTDRVGRSALDLKYKLKFR